MGENCFENTSQFNVKGDVTEDPADHVPFSDTFYLINSANCKYILFHKELKSNNQKG